MVAIGQMFIQRSGRCLLGQNLSEPHGLAFESVLGRAVRVVSDKHFVADTIQKVLAIQHTQCHDLHLAAPGVDL